MRKILTAIVIGTLFAELGTSAALAGKSAELRARQKIYTHAPIPLTAKQQKRYNSAKALGRCDKVALSWALGEKKKARDSGGC
jgi:hypothetical protein